MSSPTQGMWTCRHGVDGRNHCGECYAPPLERCDHCNMAVEVRGVNEQEWVHITGTIFCMMTVATVSGSRDPKQR